jgi:hypothetical protein
VEGGVARHSSLAVSLICLTARWLACERTCLASKSRREPRLPRQPIFDLFYALSSTVARRSSHSVSSVFSWAHQIRTDAHFFVFVHYNFIVSQKGRSHRSKRPHKLSTMSNGDGDSIINEPPTNKFKPIDFSDDEHTVSIEHEEDSMIGVVVRHLGQAQYAAPQEQQHEPSRQSANAEMIFREVPDNNSTSSTSSTGGGCLLVQRANPVGGSYATVEDDFESSIRVISPYPFSHTSQEEIEDREQLAGAFDWALQSDQDLPQTENVERVFEMDYAQFFEMDGMDVDSTASACSAADDTDDFSVASNVSDDLCLDKTDPTSFWNAGIMKNDAQQQRSESPSQVSLDS